MPDILVVISNFREKLLPILNWEHTISELGQNAGWKLLVESILYVFPVQVNPFESK